MQGVKMLYSLTDDLSSKRSTTSQSIVEFGSERITTVWACCLWWVDEPHVSCSSTSATVGQLDVCLHCLVDTHAASPLPFSAASTPPTRAVMPRLYCHIMPCLHCRVGQLDVCLHCLVDARPPAHAVFWASDSAGTDLTAVSPPTPYWPVIRVSIYRLYIASEIEIEIL